MARRTHCPDGLPLWRVGEIPEHLATATMLRRQRRRLADGQPAVASLLYRGNKYTSLYELAASVPLPALSPKRQASWTGARTCARCQATSDTPWPTPNDDRRLCLGCTRAERLAAARPSWLRLRAAAVTWASEVLANPDSVILAAYQHGWGYPMQVRAENLAGEVLVDVRVVSSHPSSRTVLTPGAINADLVVPHLMPLVGRRLIHTVRSRRGGFADWVTPLDRLEDMTRIWHHPGLRDPAVRERPEDAFGPRWTDWHARTWSNGEGIYHAHHGRHGLATVELPGDTAAELTARTRAGLAVMATDTHPDGPPTCPWLPPTGRTPCGADTGPHGLCPDHTPEDHA